MDCFQEHGCACARAATAIERTTVLKNREMPKSEWGKAGPHGDHQEKPEDTHRQIVIPFWKKLCWPSIFLHPCSTLSFIRKQFPHAA